MIKVGRHFIVRFSFILIAFSLVFGSFHLELNALTTKQNDQLVTRISKDFSNKFCNGVGFGLSQESAMSFAIKENMAIFSKKKGIENIDNKVLVEKVISSVIDKCGYSLNLSSEEWGLIFKYGT